MRALRGKYTKNTAPGQAHRRATAALAATSTTKISSASGLDDVRVEPLVKSRWGQENNSMYINYGEPCFNYYTPNNYPCGCVATAMAQVMRYHRHPAFGAVVTKTCRVGGENQAYPSYGGAACWSRYEGGGAGDKFTIRSGGSYPWAGTKGGRGETGVPFVRRRSLLVAIRRVGRGKLVYHP